MKIRVAPSWKRYAAWVAVFGTGAVQCELRDGKYFVLLEEITVRQRKALIAEKSAELGWLPCDAVWRDLEERGVTVPISEAVPEVSPGSLFEPNSAVEDDRTTRPGAAVDAIASAAERDPAS